MFFAKNNDKMVSDEKNPEDLRESIGSCKEFERMNLYDRERKSITRDPV